MKVKFKVGDKVVGPGGVIGVVTEIGRLLFKIEDDSSQYFWYERQMDLYKEEKGAK